MTFRFRNVRLDPATRQLWRDGARVPLPLKSFDCLTYLIEHRDRAVGRDELIAAVWGRAEVSDKLLGQTLLRARRAIGEAGGERVFIRTLPRFGYHWEEPVEVEPAAHSHDPSAAIPVERSDSAATERRPPRSTEVPSLPGRPRASRRLFAAIAVVTFAVAVAIAALRRDATSVSASAAPSVLVLPVAGVDGAEDSWIRLGAMDYLASHLRGARGLQVLPSEQTVALLGHDGIVNSRGENDWFRIEQMTAAAYIVAPQASRAGERWNLTLDVYHDRGTRSFEAEAATPLQAAATAADRFVESLGLAAPALLGGSPSERLQRIDAALLGGDVAQARALTETAPAELQRDPAFVLRAGRIAFRSGDVDAAERQLASIDRNDGALPAELRAQAAIGLGAIAVYRQDFASAERAYTEAIAALDSNGSPAILGKAYMERGVIRGVSQQFDAAAADLGRARVQLELAGDRLGNANLDTNIGLVETFRKRFNESLAAYDRAVTTFARFGVDDNLAIALQGKSYVQRMLLDPEGALATSERLATLAEHLDNPVLLRRVALARIPVLLDNGHLQAAEALIDRYLDEAAAPGGDPPFAVRRAALRIAQGRAATVLPEADGVLDAIENEPNPSSELFLSDAVQTYLDAALHAGRVDLAQRYLHRLAAAKEIPQDDDRAFVLALGEARLGFAQHIADIADLFARALKLAESGAPKDVVEAGAPYADYLLARGNPQDATAVLGRLMPYAARDYDAARAVARLYEALGKHDLAARAQADARRLAGERDPAPGA